MKRLLLIPLLALALLASGCKSVPSTQSQLVKIFVKNGVELAVGFGVEQSPEAIPYLRDYAAPVICEAAKGTNSNPDWVIEQLEKNAQAEAVKNPAARLIFNSLFAVYQGVYQQFGAEAVQNRAILQAGLEGGCEGILAGLPASVGALRAGPLPRHLK